MRGKFFTRFILFLFAYIPIYAIIALKSINIDIKSSYNENGFTREIIKKNCVSLLLIILIVVLIIYFIFHVRKSLTFSGNPKFRIKTIENQNKEYITYLGTYILPFIAIDTETIFDILAYILMFFTIGFIYARTNLIYTNPMLLFFGYEIFEVTDENGETYVCISKDKFKAGESPAGVSLGDKTFIIRKWKKQN